MNKKIKIIICCILLLIYGSYSIYSLVDYMNKPTMDDMMKKECESYFEGNNTELSDNRKEYCDTQYLKKDGFLEAHHILVIDKFSLITIPVIIITILTSLISVSSILSTKILTYYELRLKHSNVLKKIIKEAYRFIWILPLIMLCVILVEIYLYGLDCKTLIIDQNSGWSNYTTSHPILFIIVYIINIVLYLSTYINTALIALRKTRNYLVSAIVSFLIIIAVQIFLESIINIISTVNLINFFRLNDSHGLWRVFGFGIGCCLISWMLLFLSYKNKEKLYLDINQ